MITESRIKTFLVAANRNPEMSSHRVIRVYREAKLLVLPGWPPVAVAAGCPRFVPSYDYLFPSLLLSVSIVFPCGHWIVWILRVDWQCVGAIFHNGDGRCPPRLN